MPVASCSPVSPRLADGCIEPFPNGRGRPKTISLYAATGVQADRTKSLRSASHWRFTTAPNPCGKSNCPTQGEDVHRLRHRLERQNQVVRVRQRDRRRTGNEPGAGEDELVGVEP